MQGFTHTWSFLGANFHKVRTVVASSVFIYVPGEVGVGAFAHMGTFLGGDFHGWRAVVASVLPARRPRGPSRTQRCSQVGISMGQGRGGERWEHLRHRRGGHGGLHAHGDVPGRGVPPWPSHTWGRSGGWDCHRVGTVDTSDGSFCLAGKASTGAFTRTGMFLDGDFHRVGAVVASDGSICVVGEAGAGAFTHIGTFLGGDFHGVWAVVALMVSNGSICVPIEAGAGSCTHMGMFLGRDFHGVGAGGASDGSICVTG